AHPSQRAFSPRSLIATGVGFLVLAIIGAVFFVALAPAASTIPAATGAAWTDTLAEARAGNVLSRTLMNALLVGAAATVIGAFIALVASMTITSRRGRAVAESFFRWPLTIPPALFGLTALYLHVS